MGGFIRFGVAFRLQGAGSASTLTYQNLFLVGVLITSPNMGFVETLQKSRFWRVQVGP